MINLRLTNHKTNDRIDISFKLILLIEHCQVAIGFTNLRHVSIQASSYVSLLLQCFTGPRAFVVDGPMFTTRSDVMIRVHDSSTGTDRLFIFVCFGVLT
ncbi:Uncharacterized protein HZ326_16792 [Fusarium oxysporum f. sp. albedinis]|nr:Uncharacterized protein HZ326_16792 [Fusarium oxysporum f. sp. albedinis]